MKIGIIGTGNIGGTIARKLAVADTRYTSLTPDDRRVFDALQTRSAQRQLI